MDEYVKKEALIKSLEFVTNDSTCPIHIAAYIDQIISQEPAADVAEVRHGEWREEIRLMGSEGGFFYWNAHPRVVYVCSICGRTENMKEPYCNCGAKMDGKIESL